MSNEYDITDVNRLMRRVQNSRPESQSEINLFLASLVHQDDFDLKIIQQLQNEGTVPEAFQQKIF